MQLTYLSFSAIAGIDAPSATNNSYLHTSCNCTKTKPQTSSGGISLFKSNSGVPFHPCSLCIRVFGIHGCAWSLTPESNWTETSITTRLKEFFIRYLFFLRGRTLQHLSKLYQNQCPWNQAWHSARNCTKPSFKIETPLACMFVRDGRGCLRFPFEADLVLPNLLAACCGSPNTKLYTSLKQPHLTRARIFPATLDLPSAWPNQRYPIGEPRVKQLTIKLQQFICFKNTQAWRSWSGNGPRHVWKVLTAPP